MEATEKLREEEESMVNQEKWRGRKRQSAALSRLKRLPISAFKTLQGEDIFMKTHHGTAKQSYSE